MISAPDRENTVTLIDKAVKSGAGRGKTCDELGITERTYWRWVKNKRQRGTYEDRRPLSAHPEPANKLTQQERQQIRDIAASPEYTSTPPCEIAPALADKGIYRASESTFYRVLREAKMQNHRDRTAAPAHGARSSRTGTAMSTTSRGICCLTPAQRHSGKWQAILAQRSRLYEDAKAKHPSRWNGHKTRNWTLPETVCLNFENHAETASEKKEKEFHKAS